MSYILNLENEISWLESCIQQRVQIEENNNVELLFEPAPQLVVEDSAYAKFIEEHQLNTMERMVLILSLVPHIKPSVMRLLLHEGSSQKSSLISSSSKAQLLPTAETSLYLVAGNNMTTRLEVCKLFDAEHVFYHKGVLDVINNPQSGSQYDGELKLNQDYIESFLFNTVRRPKYSTDFPAHLLSTELEWKDLILNASTEEKITEMKDALKFRAILKKEWGLGSHIKPGYRAIFYGPSGTGKSLTATLLGKMLQRDVFRVDLSAIISKYIGETEENIRKLLTKSEDKGYILFFDEGDALFGSRTQDVKNSNDQHHNQLVAYLLQAIENFNGIIILATNLKANMDDAFKRRFQSSIFFGPPKPEQGLILWQRLWPKQLQSDGSIDFKELANAKPYTAAMIVQIIQTLSLKALSTNNFKVGMKDIKMASEELSNK